VIDQIGASESVELICAVCDVSRSCLYPYRERAQRVDDERMPRRSRIRELFVDSQSAASSRSRSRSRMSIMREEGTVIGRFKG